MNGYEYIIVNVNSWHWQSVLLLLASTSNSRNTWVANKGQLDDVTVVCSNCYLLVASKAFDGSLPAPQFELGDYSKTCGSSRVGSRGGGMLMGRVGSDHEVFENVTSRVWLP